MSGENRFHGDFWLPCVLSSIFVRKASMSSANSTSPAGGSQDGLCSPYLRCHLESWCSARASKMTASRSSVMAPPVPLPWRHRLGTARARSPRRWGSLQRQQVADDSHRIGHRVEGVEPLALDKEIELAAIRDVHELEFHTILPWACSTTRPAKTTTPAAINSRACRGISCSPCATATPKRSFNNSSHPSSTAPMRENRSPPTRSWHPCTRAC